MLWGMRPPGTPLQLEARRQRAIVLLRAGKTYQSVAGTLNASLSSVVRWAQAHRRGGKTALRPRPIPGRPPRLSATQKTRLVQHLVAGPLAAGYSTDVWTLPRIARLIARQFQVRYHPGHVWRLMAQLGWTCQKPQRRALERDEAAIAHWKRYQWPHIKKRPSTESPFGVPRRKWVPAHPQRP